LDWNDNYLACWELEQFLKEIFKTKLHLVNLLLDLRNLWKEYGRESMNLNMIVSIECLYFFLHWIWRDNFVMCYMNNIFYRCQDEFQKIVNLTSRFLLERDGFQVYLVDNYYGWNYEVLFNQNDMIVLCICKYFEVNIIIYA
jgi:hypothetical protein